jgi:hypothetical protein
MQMIWQDHPGVHVEGPSLPHAPQHASKVVDVADRQVVRAALQQIYGEEIGSARHAMASIIRHQWLQGWGDRSAELAIPPHTQNF